MFGNLETRDQRVTVRLTVKEKAMLEQLAKSRELTVAEYIRLLIQQQLEQ